MKTKILNNCNDQVSGDDDILIALRQMDFGIRTNFVRRRRDLDIVVFGNLLIAVFWSKVTLVSIDSSSNEFGTSKSEGQVNLDCKCG